MIEHLTKITDLKWDAQVEQSAVTGTPGRLLNIAIDDLVVDRRYQRNILSTGRRTISKIIANFDWAKLQPITVTPCNDWPGKYAVLDGQHRAVAAALVGSIDTLPCYVLSGMTVPEQARIFRDINATVTKISVQQLHHAGVVAGNPSAVAIDSVCRVAGITILRHNKALNLMQPDECVCVNSLAKCLRKYGFEVLRDSLIVLRKSAEGCPLSNLSARNIEIACEVIKRRTPDIDLFSDLMGSLDLEGISFDVRQRVGPGKTTAGMASIITSKLDAETGKAA